MRKKTKKKRFFLLALSQVLKGKTKQRGNKVLMTRCFQVNERLPRCFMDEKEGEKAKSEKEDASMWTGFVEPLAHISFGSFAQNRGE